MRYFLLIFVLFFAACSLKNTENIDYDKELEKKHLNLNVEQNTSILKNLNPNLKIDENKYKARFFRPWNYQFKKKQNTKNLFYSFNMYLNETHYFFNKTKIPKSWVRAQIKNANVKKFATTNKKAIVIKNTNLKNFPTTTAILKNPLLDGEGFPFDYANDSVLNVGAAVLISHYTLDKKFAFVLAESGWGFVLASALELVNDTKVYENAHFITAISENKPVMDSQNKFFFESRIGAIYPYTREDESFFYGKIGKRSFKISKEIAAKFPLEFNDENIKNSVSQLINLPYGWGGYDLQRDCSLLTRDFFSSFGIHLPRNSRAQNNYLTNFDISLLNESQKKEFLLKFGAPYASLVYLKGHIMLYIGELNNEALVFHAIWGLRKTKAQRMLIAKSAITNLDIGKEIVPEKNLLITRISSVSFISLNDNQKEEINNFLANILSQNELAQNEIKDKK